MSHECSDGVHVFNCDQPGCNRNVEGEQGEEFQDVWEWAKEDLGWASAMMSGEWKHLCPEHAG